MKLPTYAPVWNWRNKVNKSKMYPVHIRIHLDGDDKYVPVEMPRNVAAKEWSGNYPAWVKNNHPFATEINDHIKEKLNILESLVKRYYTAKKSLSFPIIYQELGMHNNNGSFITYYKEYLKNPREKLDPDTIKRYGACFSNLLKFKIDITFAELSGELFQEFKLFCETTQELKATTIKGYFNAIRKVVYWARKEHHITKALQESLFEEIEIKVGRTKKDHFELEEILQWKNLVFPEQYKSYERDRDMMLLLIFTGYYYNDLREMLKTELKKDPEYGYYFYSDRYKNDHLAIVPLWKFQGAMDLIDKFKDNDPTDPYLFKRDFFLADQVFNRRLKVIANNKDLLGWNARKIVNKFGRTTNTQLYIRFGANRPIISKMLGHENEATTNAYFEVGIRDIIEGVKNVDFKSVGL